MSMARPSARLDFSFELNVVTGYKKAELSSAFLYLKVPELLNFPPGNKNTLSVYIHSDQLKQTASKPVNATKQKIVLQQRTNSSINC